QSDEAGRDDRRPAVSVHRVRADDLPGPGTRDAGEPGRRDRVRGAGYVRAPVGSHLGAVPRAGHAEARGRRHLQLRVTASQVLSSTGTESATSIPFKVRPARSMSSISMLPPAPV